LHLVGFLYLSTGESGGEGPGGVIGGTTALFLALFAFPVARVLLPFFAFPVVILLSFFTFPVVTVLPLFPFQVAIVLVLMTVVSDTRILG